MTQFRWIQCDNRFVMCRHLLTHIITCMLHKIIIQVNGKSWQCPLLLCEIIMCLRYLCTLLYSEYRYVHPTGSLATWDSLQWNTSSYIYQCTLCRVDSSGEELFKGMSLMCRFVRLYWAWCTYHSDHCFIEDCVLFLCLNIATSCGMTWIFAVSSVVWTHYAPSTLWFTVFHILWRFWHILLCKAWVPWGLANLTNPVSSWSLFELGCFQMNTTFISLIWIIRLFGLFRYSQNPILSYSNMAVLRKI